MACEGMDTDQSTEDETRVEDEKRMEHEDQSHHPSRRKTRAQEKRKEEMNSNIGDIGVSYEMVQESVLAKLSDPEERAAYSRFRTLQRVVRENGFEASVQRWGEVQMQLEQGEERGQEPLEQQPQQHSCAAASASVAC